MADRGSPPPSDAILLRSCGALAGTPSAITLCAMHTPFDTMAKALIDAALADVCDVALQEPVAVDPLYADAVIDPRATEAEISARGMLGRIARERCVIEPFATIPTVYDVDRCAARAAMLRASQARDRALWVISPGRARSVIAAFGLAHATGWPRGVYTGSSSRCPKLVVLSELPRSRATLLLRLMGRGAVLRAALTESISLERDAWERPLVQRVLLRMRTELRRMSGDESFSKEIEMRYAELAQSVDKMLDDLREESEAHGEARGEARGVAIGAQRALFALIAARGFVADERVTAIIRGCGDSAQIERWIALAATAPSLGAVFD